MSYRKNDKRGTYQKYVLGRGWVNISRDNFVFTGNGARTQSKPNLEYEVARNAVAIRDLARQQSAPAAPPSDGGGGTGGSGGNQQVDELSRQIQSQIDENNQRQSVYQSMIDDLNKRIAEAEAARPTTGINVTASKDGTGRNVEQKTTKKISNRKNLLALEDEEDVVDTDTAALAAGTGINLGI